MEGGRRWNVHDKEKASEAVVSPHWCHEDQLSLVFSKNLTLPWKEVETSHPEVSFWWFLKLYMTVSKCWMSNFTYSWFLTPDSLLTEPTTD